MVILRFNSRIETFVNLGNSEQNYIYITFIFSGHLFVDTTITTGKILFTYQCLLIFVDIFIITILNDNYFLWFLIEIFKEDFFNKEKIVPFEKELILLTTNYFNTVFIFTVNFYVIVKNIHHNL